MNRRSFLRSLSISLAGLPMLRCAKSSDEKPNIILIMADDMGYECLSCYEE